MGEPFTATGRNRMSQAAAGRPGGTSWPSEENVMAWWAVTWTMGSPEGCPSGSGEGVTSCDQAQPFSGPCISVYLQKHSQRVPPGCGVTCAVILRAIQMERRARRPGMTVGVRASVQAASPLGGWAVCLSGSRPSRSRTRAAASSCTVLVGPPGTMPSGQVWSIVRRSQTVFAMTSGS